MKKTLEHPAKRIALGVLAALACYLALNALLALLLTRGTLGEDKLLPCVWGFAAIAAFTGAKLAGDGTPWHPAAAALAFWIAVALLGFLVNDTLEPSRALQLMLPVALGAAASCAGSGAGKKRTRKRRARK